MSESLDLTKAENWNHLIFGSYAIAEVLEAVKDPNWQRVRIDMLGRSLEYKRERLEAWYREALDDRQQAPLRQYQCQITNYVYALKRGGLIK